MESLHTGEGSREFPELYPLLNTLKFTSASGMKRLETWFSSLQKLQLGTDRFIAQHAIDVASEEHKNNPYAKMTLAQQLAGLRLQVVDVSASAPQESNGRARAHEAAEGIPMDLDSSV